MTLNGAKMNKMKIIIFCMAAMIFTNYANLAKSFFVQDTIFTHNYINSSEYTIAISNKNKNCIGYEHYKEDMDLSLSLIYKYNNFIFLLDKYHQNIKRLDLKTKEIISSEKLNRTLDDIIVRNNLLYVTGYAGSLFVLDINLKTIKTIALPMGSKFFYNDNNVIAVLGYESEQRKDLSVVYQRLKLNPLDYSLEKDSLVLSYAEYVKRDIAVNNKHFDYKQEKHNNSIIIKSSYGNYKINNLILDFNNYITNNVFCDKDSIVYFEIKRNKLIIHVYNY
jgi:hypothetical protein